MTEPSALDHRIVKASVATVQTFLDEFKEPRVLRALFGSVVGQLVLHYDTDHVLALLKTTIQRIEERRPLDEAIKDASKTTSH